MRPITCSVAITLVAAVSAPAAQACALPPPEAEAPASACAAVRLMAGHACVDDPAAPGGYRIVRTGAEAPAGPGPCAEGAAGDCVMVRPIEVRAGAWGALRRLAGL